MRRTFIPCTLLLIVLLSSLPPARGQAPDVVVASSTVSDEFLVGVTAGRATALAAALPEGAAVVSHLASIDVLVVRAPQSTPPYRLALPAAAVRWMEPNGTVYAVGDVVPNDNYFQAQQWALSKIGLPYAWRFARGMAAPLAVIDSGIDLDHVDLADRLWRNPGEIAGNGLDDDGNGFADDHLGWDFVTDDPVPDDLYYHGSHVAGIAGAATNNTIGIAGVTWETPLMAVRVLNQTGEGRWDDVSAGIIYAAANGARVLNLSLGGDGTSNTIIAAIAYARARGSLIVAAAGNSGGSVLFPARLPEVIAVGATDKDDMVWANSNRGPELDLVAPGVEILSTIPGSRYSEVTGTSMAAPHVSGVAALIWDREPALTGQELTALLLRTAHDLPPTGRDDTSGWGRLDASRAILPFLPYRTYFPIFTP